MAEHTVENKCLPLSSRGCEKVMSWRPGRTVWLPFVLVNRPQHLFGPPVSRAHLLAGKTIPSTTTLRSVKDGVRALGAEVSSCICHEVMAQAVWTLLPQTNAQVAEAGQVDRKWPAASKGVEATCHPGTPCTWPSRFLPGCPTRVPVPIQARPP